MTDRQAARSAAAALLAGAMRELEQFAREDSARVNPNRWRPLASRESLQLFRERGSSASSSGSSSSGSLRNLLLTGRLRGRVEHALFATACESLEQLALLHGFLFGDDVAHSSVAVTLEPPPAFKARDDAKPRGDDWLLDACSLSVKTVARRGADASAGAQFLEYHGHTRRAKTGELIGFYILSAAHDRADGASVRCLFQQLNNDVIDVFLVATAEVATSSSGLRGSRRSSAVPLTLTALVSTDLLFNVANLIECAESKRLTMMMRANRKKLGQRKRETNNPLEVVAVLEAGAAEKRKNECAICRRKKKLFHGFVSCDVCAEVVCTRCRLLKRVFIPRYDASDGGFFEKISACKPCVVIAGNGGKRRPTAIPVAEPEAGEPTTQVSAAAPSNHRTGRTRTRGRSARFLVKTTLYSPVGKDSIQSKESIRTRTDSTGSTSSMPTPMARATPKGGVRLLPNYDSRARKQSSASDFGGHSNNVTPRGAPLQIDWASQNQTQQQQQQQNQHERFPRFTPTLQAASGHSGDPYTQAKQTTPRYSASARQGYATASAPTTPSGSEQPWASAAQSPSNLMARMIELNKMAEISYDTTRRNGAFMTQHVRPLGANP